jgi:hypothetical protein
MNTARARKATLALGVAASVGSLIGCSDPTTTTTSSVGPRFWFTGTPVCQSPSSTITSNFNGTNIPGGAFIWFNAVVDVKGRTGPTVIDFGESTLNVAGTTLHVPNAVITFSASATTATTVYNTTRGRWETTVPVGYNGNVFLSGYVLHVPSQGLKGGANPVSWTSRFASLQETGLSFQWQWSAAVYTNFGSNAGIKPIDATSGSAYLNSDHAGTPENFKADVIGGARGGGGSNWTGSYSGTASAACV